MNESYGKSVSKIETTPIKVSPVTQELCIVLIKLVLPFVFMNKTRYRRLQWTAFKQYFPLLLFIYFLDIIISHTKTKTLTHTHKKLLLLLLKELTLFQLEGSRFFKLTAVLPTSKLLFSHLRELNVEKNRELFNIVALTTKRSVYSVYCFSLCAFRLLRISMILAPSPNVFSRVTKTTWTYS